jgi:hypothetical protein
VKVRQFVSGSPPSQGRQRRAFSQVLPHLPHGMPRTELAPMLDETLAEVEFEG